MTPTSPCESCVIHSSPSAIAILYGKDLIINTAKETIIEIWGKENDVIGKKYFYVLPEFVEQGFEEIISEIYQTSITSFIKFVEPGVLPQIIISLETSVNNNYGFVCITLKDNG